ncbi:MAG TPA: MerR family transcriptional regulator [Acidimicrobiales bacterium]|nr:MerR family transcriptional regulator [Acidimicrobiales bacterium]
MLPTPQRSPTGYRLYPPDLVERLRFIRGAKRLGLRLQDIARLVDGDGPRPLPVWPH